MITVFADTFYYLALLSEDDASHPRAVEYARTYKGRVLTTEWILTEIEDGLAPPDTRHAFVTLRQQLRKDANLSIVPATSELFEQGCDLFERRPDKGWSLTDCISFVVMEEHGVTDALTGDHHFEQAVFVALLK
jgi:predicted nucleic acid-binding protein